MPDFDEEHHSITTSSSEQSANLLHRSAIPKFGCSTRSATGQELLGEQAIEKINKDDNLPIGKLFTVGLSW